jgi:Tfp pilus assembly protein PilN
MANVNLISARRAERVRLARSARGLLLSIVVTGAVGLGGVAFLTAQYLVARSRVAMADAALEKLRPILQEIETAEQERAGLQPKLVTLTEAQDKSRRWYGIMEGLKRAVPEQTWLTNVAVERGSSENGRQLRLNGVTVSQARVGECMYRLSLQPEYYKKVDLRYTQTTKTEQEGQQAVEFELAALLYQPELEKKDDEAQGN